MLTTIRMLLVVSVLILSVGSAQAQEAVETQPEANEDSSVDAEGDPLADTTDTTVITATAGSDESIEAGEPTIELQTIAIVKEDKSWMQLDPAYSEQSILPLSGKAMYYNPGVMQRVYQNRLDSGRVEPCPECIGKVAMLRAGDLNRKVWIQLPDQSIEGPFLVVDAADTKHISMLLAREWVIDIDYETARRWQMFNPRYVTILPELTSIVDVQLRPKREFTVDIYRSEKLRYNNQTSAYFGDTDELYVK